MTESPPRGFLFFGGPWGPFFVCGTGTDGNEGDEDGHGRAARARWGAARAAPHAARVRARAGRLRPAPQTPATAAINQRANRTRAPWMSKAPPRRGPPSGPT